MKTTLSAVALLFSLATFSQNNLLQISGQINDKKSNEALVGAIVQIKGSNVVTTTNTDGKFVLKTVLKFPFTILVNIVGYEAQEFVVENEKSSINFGSR